MTFRRFTFVFLLGASVGLLTSLLSGVKRSTVVSKENVSAVEGKSFHLVAEREIQKRKRRNDDVREQSSSKIPDGGERKILLDCGANIASTVDLFRETYPGGREYVIHSFEIDNRLAADFNLFPNHNLHCPVGVASKDGRMTAYTETAWSPTRGKNNGKDIMWGGGSLFVSDDEAKNNETGGKRLLNVRPTIPVIDLSSWIQSHTSKDDYVILKLDVEGAEYDILKKMLSDGTFDWIDKFYGEFHIDQEVKGWSKKDKDNMRKVKFKQSGQAMLEWVGEKRTYQDFDEMHPVQVPLSAPGVPGGIYSDCGYSSKNVAIAIAVGMNAKRARKVIETIAAYRHPIPITLFLYGDFVELFSDDVKHWVNRFDIGVREDGHFPVGHFEEMSGNWVREALVSAELRLQELDVQPVYYLPLSVADTIVTEAEKRGFRLIDPTYEFPPERGTTLDEGNYYKFRDVARIPRALRNIHDALFVQSHGGFLVLDTDLPDTWMHIVFLLDYLVENSGYNLVSVAECVKSSVQFDQTESLSETGDAVTKNS